jgi:hypothetical protein
VGTDTELSLARATKYWTYLFSFHRLSTSDCFCLKPHGRCSFETVSSADGVLHHKARGGVAKHTDPAASLRRPSERVHRCGEVGDGSRQRRSARRKTQAVQKLSNGVGRMDRCHDFHPPQTARAFQNVKLEDASHEFGPAIIPAVRRTSWETRVDEVGGRHDCCRLSPAAVGKLSKNALELFPRLVRSPGLCILVDSPAKISYSVMIVISAISRFSKE